jgi:hypothetical protein
MQHLKVTSVSRRIGRGSTINWPPRSLRPNPVTFLFVGLDEGLSLQKESGYTRDELFDHVMDVIALIKERQDALRRATRHVLARVGK